MHGQPISGIAMFSTSNSNRSYQDNSLEQLVSELGDKRSLWYDLRVAEMSGYDYIFAPDAVCRQLSSIKALAEFLNNIQAILGSPKSRTLLISYWHDKYREQHFEKYCVEWADDIAINWARQSLDGSPQFDFVKTLFEHSEKLILDAQVTHSRITSDSEVD